MTSTITEGALILSRWADLSILVKATVMLLMGLAAAQFAGHARASTRHLMLAATFATLLALPLVMLTFAPLTIEVPVSRDSDSIAASGEVPRPGAIVSPESNGPVPSAAERSHWSAPSWTTMVRSTWIAGAILLLVVLAVDLWRLRRIRRNGLPWLEVRELTQSLATNCGVRRSPEVILHEGISVPMTCGLWRTAIVLPPDAREWTEADLRRALIHELEHVRRGDWAIQLVARAICACYWFHPLVWVAWRRLCVEAERACDDGVVETAERTDYAEQLVLLARRLSQTRVQSALGMANRSDLSTRVSALLDGGQRRGRAGLLATASAMSAAALVVFAIAPVRAVTHSRNATAIAMQESGQQSGQASGQESGSHAKATRVHNSTRLDRALFEAAESGDMSDIDTLLNAGANVNCELDGDGSPLIGAARTGQLAAVRMLLDRGADPNMPVPGDGNPLIMAAREGHVAVVELLLDRGASIDQMVPGDENALIQASVEGQLPVVRLLVNRRADVNAQAWAEGEWRTPLSMARKGGHHEVVAFLLAAGARE